MISKIVAYEWQWEGTTYVAYEAADNHVHEMVLGRDETWRDADITLVAGGPEVEQAILTDSAMPGLTDGPSKWPMRAL